MVGTCAGIDADPPIVSGGSMDCYRVIYQDPEQSCATASPSSHPTVLQSHSVLTLIKRLKGQVVDIFLAN